jgi:hypothetical protein
VRIRVASRDDPSDHSGPCAVSFSASWALFPRMSKAALLAIRVVLAWLTRMSESHSAYPIKLDVILLAVAGLRPATDQSVQGTPPHPMVPGTCWADNGIEIRPRNASGRTSDDPPFSAMSSGRRGPAMAALRPRSGDRSRSLRSATEPDRPSPLS